MGFAPKIFIQLVWRPQGKHLHLRNEPLSLRSTGQNVRDSSRETAIQFRSHQGVGSLPIDLRERDS